MSIREGDNHDIPSTNVCLTVPKEFVGQFFCVSDNSGHEKVYGKEGVVQAEGSITIFRRTIFVSEYQRISLAISLLFQKNLITKKFKENSCCGSREGVSRFSVESVLFHSTETFRRRTFVYFRKIPVSINF